MVEQNSEVVAVGIS